MTVSSTGKSRLGGVFAAVVTPVTIKGDPDTPRFLKHARWALENGCDGLNVLGTTGEATSFSATQRLKVMEAASSSLEPAKLMVGTGTPDLRTTIELTGAAGRLGFSGALVLPPFYYKGVSDAGLFRWYAAVMDATNNIPIYLYNFPQMTGINLSVALIQELAEAFPDRLAGAKDSSGDLAYAANLAAIDGLAIFPSDETALARADIDGFAGCISATVNVTAPLVARLWHDRTNTSLSAAVRNARQSIASQPLIPAVKHLVAKLHGDEAYERILLPHLPLDEKQLASLPDPDCYR